MRELLFVQEYHRTQQKQKKIQLHTNESEDVNQSEMFLQINLLLKQHKFTSVIF